MKINQCEAGHTSHRKLQAGCYAGELKLLMNTYDYELYKDVKGYCTGKDDVSRTLQAGGVWEADQTQLAIDLLKIPFKHPGIVLDFGTHVGWYSIVAGKLGYKVRGFEADPENIDTLVENAKQNDVSDKVDVALAWIDGDYPTIDSTFPVRLMKCDIEGNDTHAVRVCRNLFINGLIDYAMIEISPIFNNTYPQMVGWLQDMGYDAYVIGASLQPFDGNFAFTQANFLFAKHGLPITAVARGVE